MKARRRSGKHRSFPGLIEALESRAIPSVVPMITSAIGSTAPAHSSPAETASLTPLGAAKRSFVAAFRTTYYIGTPLETNNSAQVFLRGGGTSNTFLHGNLLLAFYPPTDTNGLTTGQAGLIGKSVSNTGDQLGVDLAGYAGPILPGRVITLGWTVNGASGGTFSNASGSGTVQIRLHPGAHDSGNGPGGAGVANVIFRGTVTTAGVYNITRI